ncbi:hypothetical protein TNCV_3832411 [Trichonephila clavipes]|nr:hypothetical protein TNCV_3832411 [Trichonephila clavipes]
MSRSKSAKYTIITYLCERRQSIKSVNAWVCEIVSQTNLFVTGYHLYEYLTAFALHSTLSTEKGLRWGLLLYRKSGPQEILRYCWERLVHVTSMSTCLSPETPPLYTPLGVR